MREARQLLGPGVARPDPETLDPPPPP
jgi:hypothetical protein